LTPKKEKKKKKKSLKLIKTNLLTLMLYTINSKNALLISLKIRQGEITV
jgi:hypothetical protein